MLFSSTGCLQLGHISVSGAITKLRLHISGWGIKQVNSDVSSLIISSESDSSINIEDFFSLWFSSILLLRDSIFVSELIVAEVSFDLLSSFEIQPANNKKRIS